MAHEKITFIKDGQLQVTNSGVLPDGAKQVDARSNYSGGKINVFDPATGAYTTPDLNYQTKDTPQSQPNTPAPVAVGTAANPITSIGPQGQTYSATNPAPAASPAPKVSQDPNKAKAQAIVAANKSNPAPSSGAEYRTASASYTSPQDKPTVSPQVQGFDATIQSFVQQINDYLNPNTQRSSLMDDYNTIKSSLGISSIDSQLLNIKNVMAGTEDDIRTEITKAGGFSTESQVQGLVYARNKNLVKQAQFLQDQKTNADDQLKTLIGLDESDRTMAQDRFKTATGLEESLISITQNMQDKAASAYDKIVSNVGYTGLASTLDPHGRSLAETALRLPPGTLSDPHSLKSLETYRQKSLQNSAQRISISMAGLGIREKATDALTINRYAMASNRIVSNYVKLPAYQLLANASPMLERIEAAATVPGSVSDNDLLDSVIKLNTGGQAITEAQVSTITGGRSFADTASVLSKKFHQGGVLSNDQRKQLFDLSAAVYKNYQKAYQPVYNAATKQLSGSGVPQEYWTLPDLNALSTVGGAGISAQAASTITVKSPNGKLGSIPADQLSDALDQGYTQVNQ